MMERRSMSEHLDEQAAQAADAELPNTPAGRKVLAVPTRTGTVTFTVEGGYLTTLARNLYLEGSWRKALRCLDCIDGLGIDRAVAVLRGQSRLSGSSTDGIDYDDDDPATTTYIAIKETRLYGNIAERQGLFYKPYAIVSGYETPATFWQRLTGKDAALGYADDPDNDRVTESSLFGKPAVLFKRCDGPPHWFRTGTLEEVATRDIVVSTLPDRFGDPRIVRRIAYRIDEVYADPDYEPAGPTSLRELARAMPGINPQAADGLVEALTDDTPTSFRETAPDQMVCGYILRDGTCWECKYHAHAALAKWLLVALFEVSDDDVDVLDTEIEADHRGWVRVTVPPFGDSRAQACKQPNNKQIAAFETWAKANSVSVSALQVLED